MSTIAGNPNIFDINLLICWGANQRQFKKGEIIYEEGAIPRFFHMVVEGKVKMMNSSEEGREFIQGFAEEGESFGEPVLFEEGPYPATAIAEDDAVIARLEKQRFIQLLKENPEVHFSLTGILARRLQYKSMVAREMAFHDPEHRIMTMLHYLKDNDTTHHNCQYKVPLTRQQLANMTGLRVETVIRTIRNLNEQGQLKIGKGKVFC